MVLKFNKKKKIREANFSIEPDEIFLDSKNLENFDQQQFEGRIEKQIPKKSVLFLGIFFFLIIITFSARLGILQIKKGESYFKRSENNTLGREIIFADRGIIFDRNKVEIAWNEKGANLEKKENNLENMTQIPLRKYKSPGFSHVVGYINYPAKDKSGFFWQTEFIGQDGLEKVYNDKIKGQNGSKIVEIDALGNIHSENIINLPKESDGLFTSLDSDIQSQLYKLIQKHAEAYGFTGGSGVILDVQNGEILAATSFPEYNSEILSLGKDKEIINGYFNDKRKVFINKVVSGLYTPGSIVKPIFALAALNENIIKPSKQIFSSGSISIPNPYFPDQPTIFKDWKAHGWTDMQEAIAVSSDVYFYTIGGGFEDQKGLGIVNIEKYSKMFGIAEKTGVDLLNEKSGNIPNPEWKKENFKGDIWRIGDTYHTAIGQYGFQVTPLEMARTIGAIANSGKLVIPHFLLNDIEKEKIVSIIDIPKEHFEVVQGGMRQTVLSGTATSLYVPYVQVAAKTGTAQIGISKNKVNSWVVGFFPYEKPKYSFVVLMESGPANDTVGASLVMRQLFDYMLIKTPQYLGDPLF